MQRCVCFLLFFGCTLYGFGQRLDSTALKNQPIYISFEQVDTVNMNNVYRLMFRGKLPNDFQQKITQYPNLQELRLNRMRLKQIPEIVWSLSNLTILDLSNNKIEQISPRIGQLQYLGQLILNRNNIQSLPSEIANLLELHYLDLWSTLIIAFPYEIIALENSLKIVDMRVINMNDDHKELLQSYLPKTKFLFTKSCNCKM